MEDIEGESQSVQLCPGTLIIDSNINITSCECCSCLQVRRETRDSGALQADKGSQEEEDRLGPQGSLEIPVSRSVGLEVRRNEDWKMLFKTGKSKI